MPRKKGEGGTVCCAPAKRAHNIQYPSDLFSVESFYGFREDKKITGRVTFADAGDLGGFESFSSTAPVQRFLDNAHGRVADGDLGMPSPADRAALDDV